MISPEEAMRQAKMTAHDYMLGARSDIDEVFGPGAALAKPALVAAYMHAAALDFLAYAVLSAVESITSTAEALEHRHATRFEE